MPEVGGESAGPPGLRVAPSAAAARRGGGGGRGGGKGGVGAGGGVYDTESVNVKSTSTLSSNAAIGGAGGAADVGSAGGVGGDAQGGAIYAGANLSVTDSTVAFNMAHGGV